MERKIFKYKEILEEMDVENISISSDKIEDIKTDVENFIKDIQNKTRVIEEHIDDLEPFLSKGDENTNLDNSYIQLKESSSLLENTSNTLNNVLKHLSN